MNVREGCLLVCLLIAPLPLPAQKGHVAGFLVARESGQPLPFGIVGIEGLDRTTFTSDSGWFSFRELAAGPHVLRVRRLGFRPRDISIDVRPNATDTIRVELTRVAVMLSAVDVRAYAPCTNPGAPTMEDDSTLATVVGQIRLNAEQFQFLADQYPFAYTSVVSRSSRRRRDGMVVKDLGSVDEYTSKRKSAYKPGAVILRRGSASFFQVPTLREVADPAFVRAHCWHFAGVEIIEDAEHYRVDVVAFDSLKGPDINGSFFVNSATFQIRRSMVHLSRRPRQMPGLLDMEVTTDFFEVLPSIPIVSHVFSVQTIDPAQKSLISEAYEEHRTTKFRFLGRKPGDARKP